MLSSDSMGMEGGGESLIDSGWVSYGGRRARSEKQRAR